MYLVQIFFFFFWIFTFVATIFRKAGHEVIREDTKGQLRAESTAWGVAGPFEGLKALGHKKVTSRRLVYCRHHVVFVFIIFEKVCFFLK